MTLLDLVAQDVNLTKKGSEWVGLCPFHGEKTPSFSVNEDKQLYFCFGCSASGDAITWLRIKRGLSFQRAAEIMGKGLTLSPMRKSPTHRALADARTRYLHWEAQTLDLITADYWRAWEQAETVELQMALLMVQCDPARAEQWERWQRLFDSLQNDQWAALEKLNFFQHPATMPERVQWWERGVINV